MPGTNDNANVAYSGTTTAGQTDTITINESSGRIEVFNMQGSARLFFNINSAANPTAGGKDCYPLPAGLCSYPVKTNPGQVVVKVFCTVAQDYAIVAVAGGDE